MNIFKKNLPKFEVSRMRWSLLRHHPSEETERRRFPSKSSFAFCRWSRSLPRGFDRRQLERRPRRDDR